jgi:hypothetical protein
VRDGASDDAKKPRNPEPFGYVQLPARMARVCQMLDLTPLPGTVPNRALARLPWVGNDKVLIHLTFGWRLNEIGDPN